MKIIINDFQTNQSLTNTITANFLMYDNGDQAGGDFVNVSMTGLDTIELFQAEVITKILAWTLINSFTVTVNDIYWAPKALPISVNNNPSRSIITGTGATGFQVSSTRNSTVQYSPTMVTTASISGNASDVIVFEICATNSATAGDWKEIGRLTNAQALTLAITLQSVQTTSGLLGGIVPAGWYAKMRAITSGTVSNTFVSGQEVLL